MNDGLTISTITATICDTYNNPTAYANSVAKAMGVTINTKISSLDLDKWAAAISQVESPQAYKELKRLGLV